MSTPRSGSPAPSSPRPGTPCTENGENQSTSPASVDAAGCPTSDSNSCSYSSRAPTPQCLPLDDQSPEVEVIPQDMMYQYMEIARSLVVEAQSRAATPCLSFNDTKAFEWPLDPFTLPSGLTLDELPDSDLCHRPEYQLTQEWLDKTLRDLNEINEEKQVAAEREVDVGDKENVDIETELRPVKRRRKLSDS